MLFSFLIFYYRLFAFGKILNRFLVKGRSTEEQEQTAIETKRKLDEPYQALSKFINAEGGKKTKGNSNLEQAIRLLAEVYGAGGAES